MLSYRVVEKRIGPNTSVVGMMKDLATSFMEVVNANSTAGGWTCWHWSWKMNRLDQLLDRYGRGW
jgi:hypothetical protein